MKRGDNGQLIWGNEYVNAMGQVEQYLSGNGLHTYMAYNPDNHFVNEIKTGDILDLEYVFNPTTGNLSSRKDKIRNLTETFTYDNLNRLTSSAVTGQSPLYLHFSNNGNITSKTDAGTYAYHATKVHAVEHIESNPMTIPPDDQNITYTPFNKVESITEGFRELQFTYGAEHTRKIAEYSENNHTVWTKYYSGDYEKTIGNTTREVHYIAGGEGLAAIYIIEDGVGTLYYVCNDYLGSILALTDKNGQIVEERNFDPWGRLRNPDDWSYDNISALSLIDRGFTGHEHMTGFGLINMNGRLYDPLLGRMLSPDNYVQLPDYTQNFNRYAYCFNNPLVYTDPSGEFVFTLLAALTGQWWALPITIGADIGAFTGGIRGAQDPDVGFWKGAGRGTLVGGVGGGLSMIGGADMPFITNLVMGTGSGAITGGLDAALWGNDIGKGILWGAAGGAVFTTLTSENFRNWTKGEKFLTNENVFNNMIERGMDKQALLDYFGFEGTYTGVTKGPSYVDGGGEGSSFFGSINPQTGNIIYGNLAFDSYDKLKMTYIKEMYHSLRVKNGIPLETQGTEFGKHLKYYPEERLGFIHAYKNQGLYPSAGKGLMWNISFYQMQSFNLNLSQYYSAKWWHFIYKIPRRW